MKINKMLWFNAENQAETWFKAKGYDCYRAPIGHPGWDIEVDGKSVNVKFARGKKRDHNELEFFLHNEQRPCFTDYYLIMFGDSWDSKRNFNMYLVPSYRLKGQSQLTVHRNNVAVWLEQYKIFTADKQF
ncbi:hypothetical protein [Lactiplantibacillus plantarum]|uniref:hypothetical protein n=2 Tax=Lactiplantibacillus plantarum TaxID=1590 RepID=UPI0007BC3045|nr:hypothetical protein [Lactiplantibacillus plantarum]AUV71133.1 hypothetical protein C1940_00985 [Lactiplantibacillus plantarum subsp. plantarum]AWY48551.1 hypothetical protein CFN49_10020 [Lactiplantibacillus plantarum]KZU04326.1 hypothetical protein Nizo2262_2329 [Lactiplantibacillus plantarum]KZU88071.1 hypothetical protein Nizo3894_1323 [Lactiplantibacillus plantarum]MCG0717268.1 hypothetical protein [Lactiplantibacillus plantarum]